MPANSKTDGKRLVGLPVAFGAEAWALLGARGRRRLQGGTVSIFHWSRGVDLAAIPSGVGPENGLAAAGRLALHGAEALVSAGLAGGLSPDLKTGDVVVGDRILEDRGQGGYERWGPGRGSATLAHSALLAKGIPARQGSILSVGNRVPSAREKGILFGKTRALALDMESAAVARAAADARIPFLALRAIIDPVDRDVDPDLSAALDEEGRIRVLPLGRSLCRRPALLPGLLSMSRDFVVALLALRRAWLALRSAALFDSLRG